MLHPSPIPLLRARDHPNRDRMARDPALRVVRRGVYAERADWGALTPWGRYLARVHAVALVWDHPTFCLESAAALQGQPVFDEPRDIHLLGRTSWHVGDVRVHGSADARPIIDLGGIHTTDLITTAVDLGRMLQPAQALAVADATLRMRGGPIDFAARGESQANGRGIRQLRWVQEHARAEAESVGESFSRAVIDWLGYEQPRLQAEFRTDGYLDRVDFHWPRQRVLGESDGYGKYDASSPRAMKAHFVKEKKREDRLRRRPDIDGFARWDWGDTLRFEPLDAALRAAGLMPVRPRQWAMLRTLGTNPRAVGRRDRPPPPKRG
ncbi:hypothetical protein [Microbacterium mangrovi]|uniref:hypothetical protein n=1 Tax=Microbacterium mangrovi TaxID=1348253 RepID=UPI00068B3BDC|nr:hypothetical protein [Microbacterium mangrovi]